MHLSRREFIERTGWFAASLGISSPGLPASRAQSYAQDYPDMLLSYLAKGLNTFSSKWDAERAGIKTPADIEARNRFVRDKFLEMIHGLPPRTPLNPQVVRTRELDGYRIENIMFESRPDFRVTGNLYVPAGRGPFPGIISPCGHYQLARMQPDYQAVYLNLVKNGFVVLAYDPIGQGERRQYWDPDGSAGRNRRSRLRTLHAGTGPAADGTGPDPLPHLGRHARDRLPADEAGGRRQQDRLRRPLGRRHDDDVHQRPGRPGPVRGNQRGRDRPPLADRDPARATGSGRPM